MCALVASRNASTQRQIHTKRFNCAQTRKQSENKKISEATTKQKAQNNDKETKRRAAKLLNLCFRSVTECVNAATTSHETVQWSTITKSTATETKKQKTNTKTKRDKKKQHRCLVSIPVRGFKVQLTTRGVLCRTTH